MPWAATLNVLGDGDLDSPTSLSHPVSVNRAAHFMELQLCQSSVFQGERGEPGGSIPLLRGSARTLDARGPGPRAPGGSITG